MQTSNQSHHQVLQQPIDLDQLAPVWGLRSGQVEEKPDIPPCQINTAVSELAADEHTDEVPFARQPTGLSAKHNAEKLLVE